MPENDSRFAEAPKAGEAQSAGGDEADTGEAEHAAASEEVTFPKEQHGRVRRRADGA